MAIDLPDLVSETIEAEIEIDAPRADVWRALTEGVGEWWPHTFMDAPQRIALEPVIGGRFYEQFDKAGAGALYALVTYLEPEKVLRVSGAMGLRGAAMYVKTYRLEEAGEGTSVRTSASVLGAIPEETIAGYRAGNQEVVAALKAHVERSRIGTRA
jgi:uncharacterized protein YndB with AHSA1/START domain